MTSQILSFIASRTQLQELRAVVTSQQCAQGQLHWGRHFPNKISTLLLRQQRVQLCNGFKGRVALCNLWRIER